MKKFRISTIVMLALGLIFFACTPEGVAPKDSKSGDPSLAGAAGDPHPALDTICQVSDTLWLAREDNGSLFVDKCYGFGGVSVACGPDQPRWGGLVLVEGYMETTNYVDCNFWMAPGWYCDFNNWQFGVGGFNFDQNGIPVVNNDWSNLVVNPVQNKWQLRLAVDNLPLPQFDLALRVGAVRLNLFGAVTPGSNTVLWGKNTNWNKTGHPAASTSPWLMHFSPSRCLSTPPPPQDSTVALGICQGCQSSNTVRFNETTPNCVDVTSCKNLSNVVVRDCNGTDYKFDGLSGYTGTFCHPSGLPIVRVYVKSGCFQSGDGPGYGRSFDNLFNFCNN